MFSKNIKHAANMMAVFLAVFTAQPQGRYIETTSGTIDRRKAGMGFTVGGIITMAVALIVAAAIFPTAIESIQNESGTITGSAGDLWDLIPLFAIIGLAIAVLGFRD